MTPPTWLNTTWSQTSQQLPCFKILFSKDFPLVSSQKETDEYTADWKLMNSFLSELSLKFIGFEYLILRRLTHMSTFVRRKPQLKYLYQKKLTKGLLHSEMQTASLFRNDQRLCFSSVNTIFDYFRLHKYPS